MLGLFTQDLQYSFFSFRRKCLDLKGLSIRERNFDLREHLDGRLGERALVGDLVVLGGDLGRRVDKTLKMRG